MELTREEAIAPASIAREPARLTRRLRRTLRSSVVLAGTLLALAFVVAPT